MGHFHENGLKGPGLTIRIYRGFLLVLAWADFPRQHEENLCRFADPGRRSQKSLALPWATLLRPLRGLAAIFIGGGAPNRLVWFEAYHSHHHQLSTFVPLSLEPSVRRFRDKAFAKRFRGEPGQIFSGLVVPGLHWWQSISNPDRSPTATA